MGHSYGLCLDASHIDAVIDGDFGRWLDLEYVMITLMYGIKLRTVR